MRSLDSILTHVQQTKTINANDILQKSKTVYCKIGGGHTVFCNPPYSCIAKWVEKAYREAQQDNTTVVLLIPARTDTRYFHDFIMHRSEIRFIRGRLKFSGHENSAPFPSMVVIFRGAYAK